MNKRRLGRTGHMSTIVIFGSAAFWEISQDAANEALDLALERGVNHIDVAPQYGQAEERVGPWLEQHREKFFVGCKTLERERAAAWAELHRSLEKLRLKSLDLYQLHAVGTFEELDKAAAKGGAIEALMEARERGLTRYLGITGHGLDTPAVHAAALERFDLDTVMFPINPRLLSNPAYRRSNQHLLEMCAQRDVGVMIIKSITRGPWGEQPKTHTTWYQPHDTPEKIEESLRFVLSQPVTGIASAGDVRLLPLILDAAEKFRPMGRAEQERVILRSLEQEPLFT